MADKKLCFVIGPIGEDGTEIRTHADWLLEAIIEPVMAEFADFVVKRADHDPRPGLIDAQMINDLLNAELVIADLSFANPNAFYEIGIRHMAQKPIIHVQLAAEKPPFDVSLYRAIKFSRTQFKDLGLARTELKRSVEAVLAIGYEVENPVTNARGRLRLEQHATPEIKVVLEQIRALQDRVNRLEHPSSSLEEFIAPNRRQYPEALRFFGGGAALPASLEVKLEIAVAHPLSESDARLLGDSLDNLMQLGRIERYDGRWVITAPVSKRNLEVMRTISMTHFKDLPFVKGINFP